MTPTKLPRPEQARINGAKSKGPTTPAGKAISSRNALKHGFAAEINVLIEPDDSDAWHAHIAGYRDSYLPTNYAETEFVDKLASIAWRQSRLVTVETALTAFELAVQEDEINELYPLEKDNPNLHLALAWHGLARKQQPPQPQYQPVEQLDAIHDQNPLAVAAATSAAAPGDPTVIESLNIASIELVRRYQTSLDRQFRNTLLNFRQYRKDFLPAQPQQIQAQSPLPAAASPSSAFSAMTAEQDEPNPSLASKPQIVKSAPQPASKSTPKPQIEAPTTRTTRHQPPNRPEDKAA